MRPGTFDRVITVERQSPTGTVDALGQPVLAWQSVWKAWASLANKSEDEAFAASQRYAKRVVTFTTYWTANLKETDRIECEGRRYDIRGVRETGYREGVEIAAEWQD